MFHRRQICQVSCIFDKDIVGYLRLTMMRYVVRVSLLLFMPWRKKTPISGKITANSWGTKTFLESQGPF